MLIHQLLYWSLLCHFLVKGQPFSGFHSFAVVFLVVSCCHDDTEGNIPFVCPFWDIFLSKEIYGNFFYHYGQIYVSVWPEWIFYFFLQFLAFFGRLPKIAMISTLPNVSVPFGLSIFWSARMRYVFNASSITFPLSAFEGVYLWNRGPQFSLYLSALPNVCQPPLSFSFPLSPPFFPCT